MSALLSILLWSFLGGIFGLISEIFLARHIIKNAKNYRNNFLSLIYLASFFKLLLIFFILFLSFKQGFNQGFACLFFYLAAKYIVIVRLARNS
jgi:hypothetical protein